MPAPEYSGKQWGKAREQALQRAGHRCQHIGPLGRCDATTTLVVHHRDGNASGPRAHRLSNLRVLCRAHHRALHRPELSPAAGEHRVWPPRSG